MEETLKAIKAGREYVDIYGLVKQMIDLIWSNDDQKFITIPDGDITTPQQIKEYYENKMRWKHDK